MNPNRFFMPGYMGMTNNMMSPLPMMRMVGNSIANPIGRISNVSGTTRGIGLFGRISNGIRSINWGGLLNGANKTLNVVNQAIPLVRQAGPMVNNMRSMMKIAKVFGSETNSNRRNNGNNRQLFNNSNNENNINNRHMAINKNNINDNKINSNNINDNSVNDLYNDVNIYDSDALREKKEEQNSNSPNFFV